jgi:high-affinity iron transporter
MQQHGRELAREMRQLGLAVVSGSRPLYALATVVGLAVLREGSEVVLFLYGVLSSGEGTGDLLLGGLMGLAVGVSTGFALYLGLLRIPHHRLFAVTSGLILFLAAGLSAQAAASLVQADLIPPLGRTVWDTSSLLPEDSLFGRLLHILVGYVAQPDGIQILFYLITLSVIFIMMQVCRPNPIELKGKS